MPQLQDTDIPVLSEEGNPVRISFFFWRDYKRYIYVMTNVLTGNRCRVSGIEGGTQLLHMIAELNRRSPASAGTD